MEADPLPETACSLVFRMPDDKVPKPSKPEMFPISDNFGAVLT
jgi:hypothetical protein